MELIVRDVCEADAAGVAGVLNPIIEARIYTALDTPFTVEAELDFIRRFPARGVFKVVVDAATERLVGFQVLEPFASYTAAFDHVATLGTYVDLERRREGIATRLFAATFAAAREKGYEKVFTFVRADNQAALRTYLARGFTVIGTARDHARVDGRYVDEILIETRLTES
jgi:L-amino acid N-acyltransferase YncA